MKNDVIFFLVRGALALLVPLPPRALHALGRALGLIAFALLPRPRTVARENIARALPELSPREAEAIARRCYLAMGGHLGDAVGSLDPARPLAPLAIDEGELALFKRQTGAARPTAKTAPRGVLFASAHLGPWERVAATLVARGVRMTVLARDAYDPRLGSIYERLRGARGIAAIYRGRPGAAARIVRTLRAGGVLGIPMDLSSRVPSVQVPFLGRNAWVPVGPARIALKMNAAVVVGTVVPDPAVAGGLRIRCAEIPTADLAPDDAGERELTARLAGELSRRILALPNEWVWMHDRFATPSAGRDADAGTLVGNIG